MKSEIIIFLASFFGGSIGYIIGHKDNEKEPYQKIRLPKLPPNKTHSTEKDYNRKREKEISNENLQENNEINTC